MPKPRRKRRSLYPEPGTWILDDIKGLPKVQPPEELPTGKLSVDQIREYITYEGLGFCVFHYISTRKIADTRLRILWNRAQKDLRNIVDYLDPIPF